MLTVQVEILHALFRAVNHVRLNLAVLNTVKGRVRTHRNSGGVTVTGLVHQPAGVHAIGRNQAARLKLKVRGREAQLAAARQTVHDLTSHHVVAAQQLGCGGHIALQQQLADAGRGAAAVLIHHQILNDNHLKAVLLPQLTHGVQVAGVVLAKAHVVTDDHETRVQRIHEGGLHELFGGLRSELQVVIQQQVVVQAQQAHEVAARALTHNVVVGHLGTVHLHRVRVKRNRDRAQTVLFSKGDHARNHAGMSTVHAVKIADGHDRGAVAGGHLAQSGVEGHGLS